MSSLTFLRSQLDHFQAEATRQEERLTRDPKSRSAGFFHQAALDYEAATRRQFRLAQADQAGELLDLRFIGPLADGTLPLEWFFKITEPLTRSWKLAAQRLRYGVAMSRVSREVESALDLKLAGMGTGSTRFYVVGNGIPDLTGESLFDSTLTQTFRLLNAPNEDFFDAVDAVGSTSARLLGESMRAMKLGGFAAEFGWRSSKGRVSWLGQPNEIGRLLSLLDEVSEPETFEENVTGRVAGIKDTGRLDLRCGDERIGIRFPMTQTEAVQRLTLHSEATIRVQASRYRDPLTKRDVIKRQMLSLVDLKG